MTKKIEIVDDHFMVCPDCALIIINGDASGSTEEQENATERGMVRIGAAGVWVAMGDHEKNEEFSHNDCECCGGLPGARVHCVLLSA